MRFSTARRRFLGSSAALAAATTLPAWFLEECADSRAAAAPLGPNDKPGIALIGCGGRGTGVAREAAQHGQVVAYCDVDESHFAQPKQLWPEATAYKDFRKLLERDDVQAIVNGTPDHWHTLINIAAMKAGKDVYSEKPLTLTIDEGKRLVAVAKETKRCKPAASSAATRTSASPANWSATAGWASSSTCTSGSPADAAKGHSSRLRFQRDSTGTCG